MQSMCVHFLGVGKKGMEHAHMWNMQGEMRDKELAKCELENKQTTMLVHYISYKNERVRERERKKTKQRVGSKNGIEK